MTRFTRRGLLAATVGAVGAMAGCAGGSSESESAGETRRRRRRPHRASRSRRPSRATQRPTLRLRCTKTTPVHTVRPTRNRLPEGSGGLPHDGDSLRFLDFPIPVEEDVVVGRAIAARAVQDHAGDETYFTYAESLFANQNQLGPDTYADLPEGIDIDARD